MDTIVSNLNITPQGEFDIAHGVFVKKRHNDDNQAQNELRHCKRLMNVTSQNVYLATLLDVIEGPTYIATVMEVAIGQEGIDAVNGWTQNRILLFDAMHQQIHSAITHLHQNGYYHLDVKLDNIVHTYANQTHVCKLSDYGTVTTNKFLTWSVPYSVGTPLYQAPEIVVFMNRLFEAEKLDVYAFGASLLFLLIKAFIPHKMVLKCFKAYADADMYFMKNHSPIRCFNNLMDIVESYPCLMPHVTTRNFKRRCDMLRGMLEFDPEKRMMCLDRTPV